MASSVWKSEEVCSHDFNTFRKFVSKDELKKVMKEKGTTIGLCEYINKSLAKWQTEQINIAVSGISGSGKSSLVNALRHLRPSDEWAEKVGVTGTTQKRVKCTYPQNRYLALWDLPGVDTQARSREEYLTSQKFGEYDVVIVVTSGRFHNNDIWLAKKCLEMKKSVLFVRTNIDIDIDNEKRDHSADFSEEQCLTSMRKDIAKNLREGGISETDCCVFFLVSSSPNGTSFEFSELEKMLRELNDIRGKAIPAILKEILTSAIEEKREFNKTEFTGRKVLAVVTGFLPLPNVETAVGNASTYVIMKRCLEKFCLDDQSLDRFCREVQTNKDEITRQLQFSKMTDNKKKIQYQLTDCKRYPETKNRFSKYMLPVFGSYTAAFRCFRNTDTCLNDMCDVFAKDELKLVKIRLEKLKDELNVL